MSTVMTIVRFRNNKSLFENLNTIRDVVVKTKIEPMMYRIPLKEDYFEQYKIIREMYNYEFLIYNPCSNKPVLSTGRGLLAHYGDLKLFTQIIYYDTRGMDNIRVLDQLADRLDEDFKNHNYFKYELFPELNNDLLELLIDIRRERKNNDEVAANHNASSKPDL